MSAEIFTSLSSKPKSDAFIFFFPDHIWSKEILAKYDAYLNKHNQVFKSFAQIMNESIQSFSITEFGFTPIEQQTYSTTSAGKQQTHITIPDIIRPNISDQELLANTFSITLRHSNAYLTWLFMLEHLFYWFNAPEQHLGTFVVEFTINKKTVISRIKFEQIIMTGMDGIELSYANPSLDFSTFDIAFTYTAFVTAFELPEPTTIMR